MVIPPEKLAQDVLFSVIEEFISREGTDYGEREHSLDEKVQALLPQIRQGAVLIVFDPETESVTLVTKDEYVQSGGHL